ncbi:MAG TPA: hypothetical protein DEA55_07845 [Rhodospirillaceae bacterium]|nr:hypothetical protein [Rhodospirillaceae bacterium]
MRKNTSLNRKFTEAHASPHLKQLIQWKKEGYTDVVLFGRFQPPHLGHMALLETLRVSGLNVNVVLNDKTDNVRGERNPFSAVQREEMMRLALPWLPPENIRHATVYLGGGGDVGNAVRRLTGIFNTLAPEGKLVFAYFEKAEDRKQYLVDGEVIDGAHYVELVGQPRGAFPIQRITEEMIEAVSEYVPIDAKMFRAAINQQDQICYNMLAPAVAKYVSEQIYLANKNNRLVGASPENDKFTPDDLRRKRVFRPDAPASAPALHAL